MSTIPSRPQFAAHRLVFVYLQQRRSVLMFKRFAQESQEVFDTKLLKFYSFGLDVIPPDDKVCLCFQFVTTTRLAAPPM